MPDICPNCGLPKDICVCETIAKEKESIKVFTEKGRYGKEVTVINGLSKDVDVKNVAKELKHKLACGGTIKDGTVQLQGNHAYKVKHILVKMGFPEDQIEVM
jgi:translation initiation factor 1